MYGGCGVSGASLRVIENSFSNPKCRHNSVIFKESEAAANNKV
jgi:hypothetical protein